MVVRKRFEAVNEELTTTYLSFEESEVWISQAAIYKASTVF